VSHIRGEKGTEVTLLIERKSANEPFEVTLKRDDIPLETVSHELKEADGKKTGVITLTSFSETTADEFNEALEDLESKDMDGLVLDVRGNPGGLLDAVEDIMENFIPNDVPYVQIEERDGEVEKYYSEREEKKDYPINI